LKVQWKKNKNLKPSILLKKIDSLKVIEDGRVLFSGFEYRDAVLALESMISFPLIADDLDKHTLVQKTIGQVVKDYEIKSETFLSRLRENILLDVGKRDNIYYLLTSLSVNDLRVRKIAFQGCIFRFYKNNFPSKFKGRKELLNKNKPRSKVESDGYTKVVVEIKAKSENIAINKSMKTLDLLRSLFAIYSNSSAELIGNDWQPINKIRLGEFHTIHNESGKVFEECFWYDPSFLEARLFSLENEEPVIKNIRMIIDRLSKFERQYRYVLHDALLRFVRAFDEKDQNIAVLRAWGALESIAAPNESNCDSVTTRCSFLFEDYEYHKQILEHLREYRNRNVHAGQESEMAKSYGFQIQRYFINIFLFHIRQQNTFHSIDEANRFLDLPADRDKLIFLQNMINKSLRFRGYT